MSGLGKTRILYVNHTGLVSGAEKVLIDVLRGLDRNLYEPFVICPMDGGLAEQVRHLNVEWRPISAIKARFAWRPERVLCAVASLCKAIAEIREQILILAPDLIHANSVRAGIVASVAALGSGEQVIWHVHDTLPRHPVSTAIRVFVLAARRTRLIAVSNATAKRVRGLLPMGKRVLTIHNGVDLKRFPVKPSGRSVFREAMGLSDEDFLVCAIGQICARKGLLELVEALQRISTQAPDMHLAIVGKVVFRHEEAYLDALLSASREAGINDRVHFTGELQNVSPALQAADLLVLNSRDEPFGLVLVEAMASGTPVLATRVGGIPEIVTNAENGWLIESGDTDALAAKLLELSQNTHLLSQVAQTARRTTCPKFSSERFQSDLAKFYAELDPNTDPQWNARHHPALARSGNN